MFIYQFNSPDLLPRGRLSVEVILYEHSQHPRVVSGKDGVL